VNICSLTRTTLIVSALIVAGGVIKPEKAFGGQTGTLPIITAPVDKSVHSLRKDNGTLPIIVTPNPPDVCGNGGDGGINGGDSLKASSYTVTVTVSESPTQDTPVFLISDHPFLLKVPFVVVVPAGSTSVTTNFKVPHSTGSSDVSVLIIAAANGGFATGTVKVHYK